MPLKCQKIWFFQLLIQFRDTVRVLLILPPQWINWKKPRQMNQKYNSLLQPLQLEWQLIVNCKYWKRRITIKTLPLLYLFDFCSFLTLTALWEEVLRKLKLCSINKSDDYKIQSDEALKIKVDRGGIDNRINFTCRDRSWRTTHLLRLFPDPPNSAASELKISSRKETWLISIISDRMWMSYFSK